MNNNGVVLVPILTNTSPHGGADGAHADQTWHDLDRIRKNKCSIMVRTGHCLQTISRNGQYFVFAPRMAVRIVGVSSGKSCGKCSHEKSRTHEGMQERSINGRQLTSSHSQIHEFPTRKRSELLSVCVSNRRCACGARWRHLSSPVVVRHMHVPSGWQAGRGLDCTHLDARDEMQFESAPCIAVLGQQLPRCLGMLCRGGLHRSQCGPKQTNGAKSTRNRSLW